MKWNVNPLIRAIDRYIQKADEDLEEELKVEGYVATGAAVTSINEIEDKLTDLLNDYTDDLLNRMEKASDISGFIENIWSDMKMEKDLEEFLIDFLHKKFTSLLNECVKEFLIDADEELGIDERITKPTQEFIENWSHELARIMRLNTNKQIEEILIKSQKEAMSIEEVSKAISDSAIRSPGYRARSVALTEVLRIESYSQLEYMRQDPAVEEKEWFHTGSHKNKPRSNHVAINGQKVPKNEPFTLTGADGSIYKPMCPRDTCLPASETVNCHCIMRTIRNEKVMGMTVEERRKLREQYMDQVDEEWEKKKAAEAENQIQWPKKREKISNDQYKKIMSYAKDKDIRLSGFKQFDGDIRTVFDLVDDVDEIATDFPLIREGKKAITILLDDTIANTDFAITREHIISINANAFRDTEKLAEEYKKLVDSGWFVKGTDYRSIIRHETGHVVENKYGLDGLEAVKKVTNVKSDIKALEIVNEKLSEYAFKVDKEIISESFSGAYSSGEKNEFALKILASFGIINT